MSNDYLFAWCNRNNLALHYGYWDEDKKYDHHQVILNTNRELYKLARIKSTDYVLDVGCSLGNGFSNSPLNALSFLYSRVKIKITVIVRLGKDEFTNTKNIIWQPWNWKKL